MNAQIDRDPLTMRYARTLRETERDPRAWWDSATAAAAEEERIRRTLANGPRRSAEPRSWIWAHRVIYAIALGLAMACFMGLLR